jgi:hypothetical protein
MKLFFDFEFCENGKTIEPISVGFYDLHGSTFYAEIKDPVLKDADKWLYDNVISKLLYTGNKPFVSETIEQDILDPKHDKVHVKMFGVRERVSDELKNWLKRYESHEFYSYCGAYDFVLLNQLCWGRMINSPNGWPFYTMDLAVMMRQAGLNKAWRDSAVPEEKDEHNALVDAKYNRALYFAIEIINKKSK